MEALSALGDPIRRGILERLTAGPRTPGELGRGFAVSRPAISRHLRVLRRAGLVREHREGRRRLYELSGEEALRDAERWLATLRRPERPVRPRPATPDEGWAAWDAGR
jgi:DNA-binding transcriptional ArsR family regulator